MFGQPTALESGFLSRSHRPVGCLACPARFERATYALEDVMDPAKTISINGLPSPGLRCSFSYRSRWQHVGLNRVSCLGPNIEWRE